MHGNVHMCNETRGQMSAKVCVQPLFPPSLANFFSSVLQFNAPYMQALHQHTCIWDDAIEYAIIAMLFFGAMKGSHQAHREIHSITDVVTEVKYGCLYL